MSKRINELYEIAKEKSWSIVQIDPKESQLIDLSPYHFYIAKDC